MTDDLTRHLGQLAAAIGRDICELRRPPTSGVASNEPADDLTSRVDALAQAIGVDVADIWQRLDSLSRARRVERIAPAGEPGTPLLTLSPETASSTALIDTSVYMDAGADRETGGWLSGWSHVVQSIHDIITTPVLTRVMRREYGSQVPRLIDAPTNDRVVLALYVAIATALARWEPRFELTTCELVSANEQGVAELSIAGVYYPRGHLGDDTLSEERRGISVWLR